MCGAPTSKNAERPAADNPRRGVLITGGQAPFTGAIASAVEKSELVGCLSVGAGAGRGCAEVGAEFGAEFGV
ncbi:hypothetical protein, partial [Arthrobacter sp. ISL-5]|uniref:hypothetical protein n=1 Tax=Arthrobacter sp. ISL-5 TaxID=2819111 RepID=UPI001BEBB3C1